MKIILSKWQISNEGDGYQYCKSSKMISRSHIVILLLTEINSWVVLRDTLNIVGPKMWQKFHQSNSM